MALFESTNTSNSNTGGGNGVGGDDLQVNHKARPMPHSQTAHNNGHQFQHQQHNGNHDGNNENANSANSNYHEYSLPQQQAFNYTENVVDDDYHNHHHHQQQQQHHHHHHYLNNHYQNNGALDASASISNSLMNNNASSSTASSFISMSPPASDITNTPPSLHSSTPVGLGSGQGGEIDDKTSLWMGDLDPWMDEAFVRGVWAQLGENVVVKMIRDKFTGVNAGYCFVDFGSNAGATKALTQLNGSFMPGTSKLFKLNWASGGGLVDKKEDQGPEFSIFVGDLGPEVTDFILFTTFQQQYPSCKTAKVVTDSVTGLSRGYGFVRFSDQSEQQSAMDEMQGQFCGSRPMRISAATPKNRFGVANWQSQWAAATANANVSSLLYNDPSNTTVFVGGLTTSHVSEEELYNAFAPFGPITYVKIPQARGCGFVSFVHRHSAEQAIAQLNGCMIGSNRVRLSWGRNNNSMPPLSPVSPIQALQQSFSATGIASPLPPSQSQSAQQQQSQSQQQSQQSQQQMMIMSSPIGGWATSSKIPQFAAPSHHHGIPSPEASPINVPNSPFLHQPQPMHHLAAAHQQHFNNSGGQSSSPSLKIDPSIARLSNIRPPMSAPPSALDSPSDYSWHSPFTAPANSAGNTPSAAAVTRPLSMVSIAGSGGMATSGSGSNAVHEDEVDVMLPSFLRDFTVAAAASAGASLKSGNIGTASVIGQSSSSSALRRRPSGVMSMPASPTFNGSSNNYSNEGGNNGLSSFVGGIDGSSTSFGALWM